MKMQINIRQLTLSLCFFLLVAFPMSSQAVSENTAVQKTNSDDGQQPTQELSIATADPSTVFSYQLKGRPDPFAPFITEKAKSDVLTGMQLFEPGQLKLVAIVFEDNAELAMVEDASGQGYAIRPGMKIGKKGIVTTIDPNQVVIEETSITRAGKQLTTNIVMLLKKKGEE